MWEVEGYHCFRFRVCYLLASLGNYRYHLGSGPRASRVPSSYLVSIPRLKAIRDKDNMLRPPKSHVHRPMGNRTLTPITFQPSKQYRLRVEAVYLTTNTTLWNWKFWLCRPGVFRYHWLSIPLNDIKHVMMLRGNIPKSIKLYF